MVHFYTPWKRQKTKDFLMFSGGIEMEHRASMGWMTIGEIANYKNKTE